MALTYSFGAVLSSSSLHFLLIPFNKSIFTYVNLALFWLQPVCFWTVGENTVQGSGISINLRIHSFCTDFVWTQLSLHFSVSCTSGRLATSWARSLGTQIQDV